MLIPEDIYRLVKQAMPIPCVDLIVIDKLGRALLVKRANYPALGEWWFPGGRVHFLETRHGAVKRKLAALGPRSVITCSLIGGSKSLLLEKREMKMKLSKFKWGEVAKCLYLSILI